MEGVSWHWSACRTAAAGAEPRVGVGPSGFHWGASASGLWVSALASALAVMVTVTAGVISRTTLLVAVGDEQVARGIDGDAAGTVQLGGGRGPAVAAVTSGAVTGDGDDVAGRLDDLPDHLSPLSAMNTSPRESTAMPRGAVSSAAVAGPLSPL